MTIRVEFFGLARTRATVASVDLDASNLRGVVGLLSDQFPDLSSACFDDGELGNGWVFNINGRTFVSDLDIQLNDNDSVLLMSADVGG